MPLRLIHNLKLMANLGIYVDAKTFSMCVHIRIVQCLHDVLSWPTFFSLVPYLLKKTNVYTDWARLNIIMLHFMAQRFLQRLWILKIQLFHLPWRHHVVTWNIETKTCIGNAKHLVDLNSDVHAEWINSNNFDTFLFIYVGHCVYSFCFHRKR